MTRRMDLFEIKKKYEETGCKPVSHVYLDVGCACPFGILYGTKMPMEIYAHAQEDGFTKQYIAGFISGFDDFVAPKTESGDYLLGYQDGQHFRKELL